MKTTINNFVSRQAKIYNVLTAQYLPAKISKTFYKFFKLLYVSFIV